jgi:hypothetical protein
MLLRETLTSALQKVKGNQLRSPFYYEGCRDYDRETLQASLYASFSFLVQVKQKRVINGILINSPLSSIATVPLVKVSVEEVSIAMFVSGTSAFT